MSAGGRYRRARGVRARRVGSSLFLAHPRRGEVYRCNVTMAGVWHALVAPLSAADIERLFRAAFPRVGPARLRATIRSSIGELEACGLIERAPARPAARGRRTR